MPENDIQRVDAVRRFNRFYTRQIGLLNERLLSSPFSLTEARVMYELAHRDRTTASALSSDLALDPGYLSRILRGFRKGGLVGREASQTDGRQSVLWLTEQGQQAFAELNGHSRDEIEAMLGALSPVDQERLVASMHAVEELLLVGGRPESRVPYILRPHQPGDMGWVVHRHGVLYAREYGWDEQFEALVAGIVSEFIRNFDSRRERCWIAEMNGEIVGSVFLVKLSDDVAKLRMLWVEPKARGMGIGARLVKECVRFAQQTGYKKITLWTNSVLVSARRLYDKAGFTLVHSGSHHAFGHDLVEETWELEL